MVGATVVVVGGRVVVVDGTMVVVDHARKMMGKTIDIVVTSVLQTTAGRMIFGRYTEATPVVHSQPPAAAERDEGSKKIRA